MADKTGSRIKASDGTNVNLKYVDHGDGSYFPATAENKIGDTLTITVPAGSGQSGVSSVLYNYRWRGAWFIVENDSNKAFQIVLQVQSVSGSEWHDTNIGPNALTWDAAEPVGFIVYPGYTGGDPFSLSSFGAPLPYKFRFKVTDVGEAGGTLKITPHWLV